MGVGMLAAPEGYWGGNQITVMAKKKKNSVKMMFLEMFLDVLTTRGHTWTWQCCYSVGVVSATICGQYVR
jgi:hypothetical protein